MHLKGPSAMEIEEIDSAHERLRLIFRSTFFLKDLQKNRHQIRVIIHAKMKVIPITWIRFKTRKSQSQVAVAILCAHPKNTHVIVLLQTSKQISDRKNWQHN